MAERHFFVSVDLWIYSSIFTGVRQVSSTLNGSEGMFRVDLLVMDLRNEVLCFIWGEAQKDS